MAAINIPKGTVFTLKIELLEEGMIVKILTVDEEIVSYVKKKSREYKTVLVALDSNHTHDHVYQELNAYAKLVSINSYCINQK